MPASANGPEPEADRTHIIIRRYDAPARLLFEAWSKREHLMKWFGPKGWPVTMCELDFRVGGRFRMAMTGPSGVQDAPFGGQYREIEPNRKIVFDNGFERPGAPRMIMTVTFEEAGGSTTLTITTLFESVAMKTEYLGLGFEQGFGSGLDQLGELAAQLRAKQGT